MKRFSFILLLSLLTGTLFAQTAAVQVIHNSPDAGDVDIYVNGAVAIPALSYLDATGFVEIPVNATIAVGLAGSGNPLPGTDVGLNLTQDETYLVFAVGAIDTTNYNTTVANGNGVSAGFGYLFFEGHDTTATAGNVSLTAVHGAIDADTVDILANGAVVVDDIAYPGAQGVLTIPTQDYVLQVTPYNDNETVAGSFVADLDGLNLDGQGIVVFAGGFLDPAANNDGEPFGLFAVTKGGAVLPLSAPGNSRVQVIHNAADVAAASVDIYVDLKTDTVKFEDVPFRGALPFTDLPTGYEIEIVVALPTSTDITDGVVQTFPATLEDGESYYVIAQGILPANLGDYDTMTNMGEVEFTLVIGTGAREEANDPANFDLEVFHGSTDTPPVDVAANGDFDSPVVSNLSYTGFNGYLELPPAVYDLGVGESPVNGEADVLATFRADLSAAAGGAGILLASGFLDPTANNSGEALGLLFVLPNGDANLLPLATSIRDLEQNNELISFYPNPATSSATLSYEVREAGEVSVQMLDAQGRAVLSRSMEQVPGSHRMTLDTEGMSRGVHLVVVTTNSTRSIQRVMLR